MSSIEPTPVPARRRTGAGGRNQGTGGTPGGPAPDQPGGSAPDQPGGSAPDQPGGSEQRLRISDPEMMRAMAHPARLAVLDHLVTGGTATATECARIAGLSPSAMSYHLRALAKIGLVEEAPSEGDARERRWRATLGAATGVDVRVAEDAGPQDRKAELELLRMWLVRMDTHLRHWLDRALQEPPEWNAVLALAELRVRLTSEELAEVNRQVFDLLKPYSDRQRRQTPPGARRLAVQYLTVPLEDPPAGP